MVFCLSNVANLPFSLSLFPSPPLSVPVSVPVLSLCYDHRFRPRYRFRLDWLVR